MIPRSRFALPVALALLLGSAASAIAQDGMGRGVPGRGAGEEPDPAAAAAVAGSDVDTRVEIKGNRYRILLRMGSRIEGILPRGLHWERIDQYGDYVDASEKEKGAGLRLQYVLNMEGDIFIKRDAIAVKEDGTLEIRDRGALTEDEKLAIRQRIIADRKKVIEQREQAIREEIERLTGKKAKDGAGKDGSGKDDGEGDGEGDGEETDAETVKKGEALLEKFPPKDWSEDRLKEILRREVINGIFRNDEEREFIDNFKAWKEALERREEAEKKEGGKAGGATGSGNESPAR